MKLVVHRMKGCMRHGSGRWSARKCGGSKGYSVQGCTLSWQQGQAWGSGKFDRMKGCMHAFTTAGAVANGPAAKDAVRGWAAQQGESRGIRKGNSELTAGGGLLRVWAALGG